MTAARRRLRGEDGFALTQLLVSASIMVVILGATLGMFTNVGDLNRQANARGEAHDEVRRETDRLARALRNLAAPVYSADAAGAVASLGIDEALPFSLVFRTVDRQGPNAGDNAFNVRRVRWCLEQGPDAQLFEQVQTWTSATTPAVPSTVGCPDAAWGNQRVVARHVTNRAPSPARGVFGFNAVAPTDVTHVRTELFVDVNGPLATPGETRLRSGVFLRNHNRRPRPDFTAEARGGGSLLLNGSLSADPEGEPLRYVWRDGEHKLCEGMIVTCPALQLGVRQITLVVLDRAGLEGAATKEVEVL